MKIKVGDIVKGVPGQYGITNENMTRGIVTEVDGSRIKVAIIEHTKGARGSFDVCREYFEIIGHAKPFDRKEALDAFKADKRALLEYGLSGAGLSDADLSRADLRGAGLSDADLSRADLRDADLRDADLSRADLSRADLSGADLSRADLRDADLSRADLRGADLSRADLSGANLRYADLSGADLSRADLDFSCLPLQCGGLRWKIDKRIAAQLAYHLCSMQCDDPEFIAARNALLPFANKFHRVGECGKLETIEVTENETT